MTDVADESTNRPRALYDCYTWRLERCLVRVRWLAVPACFVVPILSSEVPVPLISLFAAGLALGNLGIDRLLRHAHNSTCLRLISGLATGLEWITASGIIGWCSRDLERTAPVVVAVALTLVVIETARYGVAGWLGALGALIAVLIPALVGTWPVAASRLIEARVILVAAASAIVGWVLLWLRQEERRWEAESTVLRRRLDDEERRWHAEHVALQRFTLGISPREWEVLCLLAKGLTYEQIADLLSISEETVRSHVHHLSEKLGLPRSQRHRQDLLGAARERGLFAPAES